MFSEGSHALATKLICKENYANYYKLSCDVTGRNYNAQTSGVSRLGKAEGGRWLTFHAIRVGLQWYIFPMVEEYIPQYTGHDVVHVHYMYTKCTKETSRKKRAEIPLIGWPWAMDCSHPVAPYPVDSLFYLIFLRTVGFSSTIIHSITNCLQSSCSHNMVQISGSPPSYLLFWLP